MYPWFNSELTIKQQKQVREDYAIRHRVWREGDCPHCKGGNVLRLYPSADGFPAFKCRDCGETELDYAEGVAM